MPRQSQWFAAACLAAGVFALTGTMYASGLAAAAPGSGLARVAVDGHSLPADAMQMVEGRQYVTLHALAAVLGADVTSNGQADTVTLTTLLRQVIFHVDDRVAVVDSQRVSLDAPPRRIAGRVLVSLRSLATSFAASLTYRRQDHTVVVTTRAGSGSAGWTQRPVSATKTLQGTVSAVQTQGAASVQLAANGDTYTIAVPLGARIEFRDVRGALTGSGSLGQVQPGDALIVTLGAGDQLIAMADIFASTIGTVAAVAGKAMVLTNGKVVAADQGNVSVRINGHDADFSALRPGDKVSVRSDPNTGRVRDVVALSPAVPNASGTATPSATGASSLQIKGVRENADHAFRIGQDVRVEMDGTPGGLARFDLSDIVIDNAMRETYPGHYEGDYRVSVGTNLADAPIVVRLRKNGAEAVAQAPDALTIITTPPSVRETAPASGQQINNPRPNIYLVFGVASDKGMDVASLRVLVNGQDVTGLAIRTSSYVSYYPRSPLRPGTVLVEVRGTDIAGNALRYQWSFFIRGA
ncbi:MAG: copper amine oxidase N-terminal domain-containing protein [Candidatus Eremiobacteraeota bacterium]|nr:copper amine oxidase N-terminal domain-containing protein [Candidatus Eremiobacteraeota bacterium]